jgi:arabinofuranosyltransferase
MPTDPAPAPRWLSPSVRRGSSLAVLAALVVLFAVVVVRTAWLSEDAYFTFRSVENWVYGYGARWNVNERVQAYTHPLWFALLSALFFVTREMAVTGFALGFLCTAGTVYVLVRRVGGASWVGGARPSVALALGCLIASKAFTDYSTSGLENPLSHLLLLLFFAQFWADEDPDPVRAERSLAWTCLFGGLLVCNRLDLGLILAPALVYALWPGKWAGRTSLKTTLRRALAIGVGFSPLIVWELISLVYYGSWVPNTAYAKLGAQLPTDFVLRQGVHYFANSLRWDPVTLLSIAVITIASLAQLRQRPKQACAALGVLLYLGYVLAIGGDYMSGRFFTAPLAVAAGLLANRATLTRPTLVVGAVVLVILAFMAPSPTVFAGKDYSEEELGSDNKVDDERGYRHVFAGLISTREVPLLANSGWYKRGLRDRALAEKRGEVVVAVKGNGGYMGYAAGPQVHYINPYGITDPLLARLPGSFRAPGHIHRPVPPGYHRAAIGKGRIHDPNLHAYWRELALITRAPIWSRARWAAIWRMHTGANQPLLDAYLAAQPPPRER